MPVEYISFESTYVTIFTVLLLSVSKPQVIIDNVCAKIAGYLSFLSAISEQTTLQRLLSDSSLSLRRLASGDDDWWMTSLPVLFKFEIVV